jgi:hypothetical protein
MPPLPQPDPVRNFQQKSIVGLFVGEQLVHIVHYYECTCRFKVFAGLRPDQVCRGSGQELPPDHQVGEPLIHGEIRNVKAVIRNPVTGLIYVLRLICNRQLVRCKFPVTVMESFSMRIRDHFKLCILPAGDKRLSPVLDGQVRGDIVVHTK